MAILSPRKSPVKNVAAGYSLSRSSSNGSVTVMETNKFGRSLNDYATRIPESREVRRERTARAIERYEAEKDRRGSMAVIGKIMPTALFAYAAIGFCVWYF